MGVACRSKGINVCFFVGVVARKTLTVAMAVFAFGLAGSAESAPVETIAINPAATLLQLKNPKGDRPKARLILYTTMATWCVACGAELPQFVYLRSVFKPEELEMYGLPYDVNDEAVQLKSWAETNAPPYKLLDGLTKSEIAAVKRVVLKNLKIDAVPTCIVTDGSGRILRARWGPPSVSELRELLRLQAG